MSSAEKNKRTAKVQWARILKDALNADSWGQSLEATEEYERLARLIQQDIGEMSLTADEKVLCAKVRFALLERAAALQDLTGKAGIKSDEAKRLAPVMDDLFERPIKQFPIALPNFTINSIEEKDSSISYDEEKHDVIKEVAGGSLKPPPAARPGMTSITMVIEKIGLKDAEVYIQPHLTISVADSKGRVIESQDTPHSNRQKPNYVHFGTTVYLQTPLEELKQDSRCVFFEFKHYKPKKKKISTRCFAFMEYDEIAKAKEQGGVAVLELYQKPTDYARKRINLFTIKPLYLHLQMTFHS